MKAAISNRNLIQFQICQTFPRWTTLN